MKEQWNRRKFLKSAGVGSAFINVGVPFGVLSRVSAAEAKVTPELVRFNDDIEPLVRLIENTPREKCIEMLVEQLRRGIGYRQFVAALFLAGLRNFGSGGGNHCVYVIHSAHQLSLDARPEERLLPLAFALDRFKRSQNPDSPRLAILTGPLPSASKAPDEFREAMDTWDAARADGALVALVRSRGLHEIGDLLFPYGTRDWRDIGHKAIFVANAWRTLETIGWQHAEVLLRSLAYALVRSGAKDFERQSYLPNVVRVRKTLPHLPPGWAATQSEAGATEQLLAALRKGVIDDTCHLAATLLAEGKASAASVWDAVHLAAAETILRDRDLDGVHAVTSANAMHYLFRLTGEPANRLLILLQAVGWVGMFREELNKQKVSDVAITELVPAEIPFSAEAATNHILGTVKLRRGTVPEQAGPMAFAYARANLDLEIFLREARRLVCLKSFEVHQYKYPAAIFEDMRLVNPRWRPHMLAASVHYLHGSGEPDAQIVQRAREAFGTN